MSRHRNMKVSYGDDASDYDEDLAQSFDEINSYAVSPGTTEMYMFNRSNEAQNISQFIKASILEEDDDDNASNDNESMSGVPNNLMASSNHDDVFQMENKEPPVSSKFTFEIASMSGQTSGDKIQSKDYLDSLLDEIYTPFNETVTVPASDPASDPDLVPTSLASLSTVYSVSNTKPQDNKCSAATDLSLDKLLDEFLLETTNNTNANNSEAYDLDSLIKSSESIRITDKDSNQTLECSLNDLASQYLTPSSQSCSPCPQSLSNLNKDLSVLSGQLFDNKNESIGLETLLLDPKVSSKSSKILKSEQNDTNQKLIQQQTEIKMQSRTDDTHSKRQAIEVELIINDKSELLNGESKYFKLLNSLFYLSNQSQFARILKSKTNYVINMTNEMLSNEFAYAFQKENFNRKRSACKRKPVMCQEELGHGEIKNDVNDESDKKSAVSKNKKQKSSAIGKGVAGSGLAGSGTANQSKSKTKILKPIVPFDFSIPSPDDIVIAKQKLAFKRFK